MKYLLMLLLLVSTPAFAIDSCFTGSWYDPDRNGEGIDIQILDTKVLTYFYTFNKYNEQTWYTMLGDGIMVMRSTEVLVNTKDDFITKNTEVGVAEIEVLNNNAIRFRFELLAESIDGKVKICKGDHCIGDYIYRRITLPIGCE